jgi:mannose-6-phosphate isomerase-like protein (cupin superfamily)
LLVKTPIITKKNEIRMGPNPAADAEEGEDAGSIGRVVGPDTDANANLFLGVAEVNPGFTAHKWHVHTHDKGQRYEIHYPKDFEEIYYVTRGSGVVQWETEEGNVEEVKVGEGDVIYFPIGVARHQLLNDSDSKLTILYTGTPMVPVTLWPADD